MQVFYILVAYITQNLIWQILQLVNTVVSTSGEEPQNGTTFILSFNDQHSGVQRSHRLFQSSWSESEAEYLTQLSSFCKLLRFPDFWSSSLLWFYLLSKVWKEMEKHKKVKIIKVQTSQRIYIFRTNLWTCVFSKWFGLLCSDDTWVRWSYSIQWKFLTCLKCQLIMTNKQLQFIIQIISLDTGQGLNFNVCQGKNARQDGRKTQCLLRLNGLGRACKLWFKETWDFLCNHLHLKT